MVFLFNIAQAVFLESFGTGSMLIEDLIQNEPMYDKLLDLPDLL